MKSSFRPLIAIIGCMYIGRSVSAHPISPTVLSEEKLATFKVYQAPSNYITALPHEALMTYVVSTPQKIDIVTKYQTWHGLLSSRCVHCSKKLPVPRARSPSLTRR